MPYAGSSAPFLPFSATSPVRALSHHPVCIKQGMVRALECDQANKQGPNSAVARRRVAVANRRGPTHASERAIPPGLPQKPLLHIQARPKYPDNRQIPHPAAVPCVGGLPDPGGYKKGQSRSADLLL